MSHWYGEIRVYYLSKAMVGPKGYNMEGGHGERDSVHVCENLVDQALGLNH